MLIEPAGLASLLLHAELAASDPGYKSEDEPDSSGAAEVRVRRLIAATEPCGKENASCVAFQLLET